MTAESIKGFIGYYVFPVTAALAFALVSHPDLAAWALARFGWVTENTSTLGSDVRTLLILIGFAATGLSIWYARREVRSLTELNQRLTQSETKLVETEQSLSKRLADWVDFKRKSFEGLKGVLDSYISNLVIEHYKEHGGANPPGSMRVSIYTHDERNEEFSLIGRYSYNYLFKKKGRASYPLNSGAIGKAWIEGDANIVIQASPSDEMAYRRELEEYGMGRSEIDGLTMRSVSFFAKRLNGGSSSNTPIGVVLIESTDSTLSDNELKLLARIEEDGGYVVRNVMFHEYVLHKEYPREE